MKRIAVLLAVAAIASAASAEAQPAPSGCSAIEVTAPGLRKQPRVPPGVPQPTFPGVRHPCTRSAGHWATTGFRG
jgi:hypothetical protein